MPAAPSRAVAVTPEYRPLPGRRGMDPAIDFLQQSGEELIGMKRGHDEELAAWPENVKGLVGHVDLQLTLTAAGHRIQHGLGVPRQVPQIGCRHDLRG